MQGKKVLELGAGTGLVTTVASLLGEQSSLSYFQTKYTQAPTQKSHSVWKSHSDATHTLQELSSAEATGSLQVKTL